MLHYFILRALLTEIQHVNKNLRGLYYSIHLFDPRFIFLMHIALNILTRTTENSIHPLVISLKSSVLIFLYKLLK
jgi:hypothetical protein